MNIYTIAELAGVSPSTVSKVINNKGSVSAGTRRRILDIVAENNFQPRTCSNIASNIALFFRRSQGDVFASSYGNAIVSGISSYFIDKLRNLLFISTNKIPLDRIQFQTFCHHNHIDGAIFLNATTQDTYISELSGIVPFVVVGLEMSGQDLHSVYPNDYQGSHDAITYLLEMGHRNIAFPVLDQAYYAHARRLEAYKDVLRDYGIPLNPRYLFDSDKFSETDFRMLWGSWEQLDMLPTAIMCSNDDTAVLLLSHLRQFGVRIPEDISIVGFDDYSYSVYLSPALTTVRQPIGQLGWEASRILDERINNRIIPQSSSIVLPEELIIRHSVKKIGSAIKKDTD